VRKPFFIFDIANCTLGFLLEY